MILRGSYKPLAAIHMIHRHLIGRGFMTQEPKLTEGLIYLGAGYWRAAVLGTASDYEGTMQVDTGPDRSFRHIDWFNPPEGFDVVGFRLINPDKKPAQIIEYEKAVALLAGLAWAGTD